MKMPTAADTLLSRMIIPVPMGPLRGLWWTVYPWSSYWRGSFEPRITARLRLLLPRPGSACWDIGAHFGYYATIMARHVGPGGHVLALEPNPRSFRYLKRHQRWNRLCQLVCLPFAASDHNEHLDLLNYDAPTSTTSHFAYPGEQADLAPGHEMVRAIRLDDLMTERQFPDPTLVKIDVEGHGAAVIRGSMATLTRNRPTILFAAHHAVELDETQALLAPLGYDLRNLDWPASETTAPAGDYLFLPRPSPLSRRADLSESLP